MHPSAQRGLRSPSLCGGRGERSSGEQAVRSPPWRLSVASLAVQVLWGGVLHGLAGDDGHGLAAGLLLREGVPGVLQASPPARPQRPLSGGKSLPGDLPGRKDFLE